MYIDGPHYFKISLIILNPTYSFRIHIFVKVIIIALRARQRLNKKLIRQI